MDSGNLGSYIALSSLILNVVVILFQANLKHSMSELKVYMHENFTTKE